MPSIQSNCCTIAKTMLASVSGLDADRIKIGIYDQQPTQNFFADLAAGYFVQIEPVKFGEFEVQSQIGGFDIVIKFYFKIPPKEDFTYQTEQDVAVAMRAVLATPSNWTNLPCPNFLSLDGPETLLDNGDDAGLYKISVTFNA